MLSGIPGLSAKQVMVVLRVVLGGDRSSPEGRGPFSVVPLRHLDLSGVQVGGWAGRTGGDDNGELERGQQ